MKTKNGKFVFKDKKLSRKEKIKLCKIFLGICKLMEEEVSETGNNKVQRIKALEDNIIRVIKKYPELLHITRHERIDFGGLYPSVYTRFGETIFYYILYYKLDNVIVELCKDFSVYQLNVYNDTILIEELIEQNNTALIKNLIDSHPELLSFQNKDGENFANLILRKSEGRENDIKAFEPYIIASLKDEKIAIQQDYLGYNIGMLCAKYKFQKLFDIAYQNEIAREQTNKSGEIMKMIANNNGLIVPPLTDEEVYNFYNNSIEEKIEEMLK